MTLAVLAPVVVDLIQRHRLKLQLEIQVALSSVADLEKFSGLWLFSWSIVGQTKGSRFASIDADSFQLMEIR